MIEKDLHAALTAESPSLNVYPDEAPQEATPPFVIYTLIGGHDEMSLEGDDGLRRRLVQVDVWAKRREMASNLMEGVRSQMLAATAFSVAAMEETGAPRFDFESKLFRSSYEFAIWYQQ